MSDFAYQLRTTAVEVWVRNVGYGETTGNNAGPFIEALGGRPGYEWCALYVGHGYRRAFQLADEEPPPWLYRHTLLGRHTGRAEAGARELCKQLGKVAPHNYWAGGDIRGVRFTDVNLALPGDLLLLKRPGGYHVAGLELVADGICHTLEGNIGKFPSKAKRNTRDPRTSFLAAFYGLR